MIINKTAFIRAPGSHYCVTATPPPPGKNMAEPHNVEVNCSSAELPIATSNGEQPDQGYGMDEDGCSSVRMNKTSNAKTLAIEAVSQEEQQQVVTGVSYPYVALGFIFISTVTQR